MIHNMKQGRLIERCENRCPECKADCHRGTDAQWGAGNRPIPIYGRTGRKLREVYCDNGCACVECQAYWKAQNGF